MNGQFNLLSGGNGTLDYVTKDYNPVKIVVIINIVLALK